MVDSLYWISDIVFAAAILINYVSSKLSVKEPSPSELAFRNLGIWVVFFFLQDAIWGIIASGLMRNDTALMISSTVFHLSSAITVYVWIKYVLAYMGDEMKHPKFFVNLGIAIVILEIVLLSFNFFQPTIFYIDENGIYCVGPLRFVGFFSQYLAFLLVGLEAGVTALKETGERRKRHKVIGAMSTFPILIGTLQYLFPYAPFHSITYFLCGMVGHCFILADDRAELAKLQQENAQIENELKIAEQKLIANTDKMTGCHNRRAYEAEMAMLAENGLSDDFVYVSADVNGLKVVNDTLGHAAGDELLKGAVACMKKGMGKYGKIFRLGGDEFAIMIYAKEHELNSIKKELDTVTFNWSGDLVKSLAISFGFVEKRENLDMSLAEMEQLADKRMYEAKQNYYASKGIDRRGQHTAYEALCASYEKILKVNLSDDSYRIITMEEEEHNVFHGFSDKVSEWFYKFAESGDIHPDDINMFEKHTAIENLRSVFSSGKNLTGIAYRRKIIHSEGWHQVLMEMVRAEDYSDDNQSVYLYVKALDK